MSSHLRPAFWPSAFQQQMPTMQQRALAARPMSEAAARGCCLLSDVLSILDMFNLNLTLKACYVCRNTVPSLATLAKAGDIYATRHHLIPRSLHDKAAASGLFTLAECQGRMVDLCNICHSAAHGYFTSKEMARFLSTSDRLYGALCSVGWLE